MNARCQILHTGCTNINGSIDHNVTSFNVVREDGCNIKFPQLLTEIIQGLCNFRLSYNLFICNLRWENWNFRMRISLLRERDHHKLNHTSSTQISARRLEWQTEISGNIDCALLAIIRKFLTKELNAVKTHSIAYANLDHSFLSLIDVSHDLHIALILFLNCESPNPSGSPLSSLKSKEFQEPLRILIAVLSWVAASTYLIWARCLSL